MTYDVFGGTLNFAQSINLCYLFGFWVQALFSSLLLVTSTSAVDCPGRFVIEMTCYVSTGTLNLTN